MAEKLIPLGSQTFSKSRTQYPVGISPLYVTRAKGCHTWDIDGNKYIDLVSSLASITLGYQDRQLNRAIRKQLNTGTIFSLPGKLEYEVAEKIVNLVPSAEQVRFGKNGSDATSAAIRLARAVTGRQLIAVCGYHGWQDWYIGSTTRNKGVPTAVSNLTKSFTFNNLESVKEIFEQNPGNVAAVILEPMNINWPEANFLEEIRALCTKQGTVLIFDETITGFRFSKGGAQELFGVLPDLTTLGKGLANGFPLSAVVGKREIMAEMNEIFFSGTFGGELLSLAAANEVLTQHLEDKVIPKLYEAGESLNHATQETLEDNHLSEVLELSGHPTWRFLTWKDHESASALEIKTYFMQECFKEGILVLGTHNVTTAHSSKIIKRIGHKYSQIFSRLRQSLEHNTLKSKLETVPLQPLFKVR
ncbi:HemL Glutamate-1-semialdehyde aminotransferase [Candidatus Nanopelagicaceae bacterium]